MAPVLAAHAEKYASLGWALVELAGKMPIGFGWQNSEPLDTRSAYEVWALKQATAISPNMGLVLGPSGVIDFELDSGDEDLFWELAKTEHPTPIFFTGRGKPHVLFKDPGGLSRRTRDGLELRAGPHQSVIPPSIHPDTGKAYEWLNNPFDYELQPPPQRLLEFFATANNGPGESHWREALGRKLGEGEGRHASLISYLGLAVNQFETPEQLVAAAIAYASVTQDPPYPDDVIEDQALDCWNRYREEPVQMEPEQAREYLHIQRADRIQMKNVKFLWEPFIQKSALHLMVGRKGVGKGTLLARLAALVTKGEFEKARGVLWISGEDSFEMDVLPRFKAQGGVESRLLAVRQRVIFPRDLPALRAVCEDEDVGLVVLDPIVSVIGGANANDEASIYNAIGPLNELSDNLDTAVIGVRHIGKNTEYDSLEGVLGSVAWVNIPRAVLNVAQSMSGVEKNVTLTVLASNRVRAESAAWFSLVEVRVDGVDKPVPMVVPQ